MYAESLKIALSGIENKHYKLNILFNGSYVCHISGNYLFYFKCIFWISNVKATNSCTNILTEIFRPFWIDQKSPVKKVDSESYMTVIESCIGPPNLETMPSRLEGHLLVMRNTIYIYITHTQFKKDHRNYIIQLPFKTKLFIQNNNNDYFYGITS